MKITKFGDISELDDGCLRLQNFSLDCTGTELRGLELMLTLIIERLQQELADLKVIS